MLKASISISVLGGIYGKNIGTGGKAFGSKGACQGARRQKERSRLHHGGEVYCHLGIGTSCYIGGTGHYGDQYKKWSLDTLPMLPKTMALKVIPETSKQYRNVKALLLSKDVSSVIIATDAGREGELVARWIIDKSGCKKPLKRLWISSQTDRAIKEGFAHLKDGKEYLPLYRSAQSRAEADWLVGLNVTRALTCKFNAQLSAGRVQTPTLALLVRREKKNRGF